MAAFRGIRVGDLERWPTFDVDAPRGKVASLGSWWAELWEHGYWPRASGFSVHCATLKENKETWRSEQSKCKSEREGFQERETDVPCPAHWACVGLIWPDSDSPWGHLYWVWSFSSSLQPKAVRGPPAWRTLLWATWRNDDFLQSRRLSLYN